MADAAATVVWRDLDYSIPFNEQSHTPIFVDAAVSTAVDETKKAEEPKLGDTCLDVFRPSRDSSTALLPVLVFIHGGLWVSGSKHEGEHIARFFVGSSAGSAMSAESRMAVALVNYPLSPKEQEQKDQSSFLHPQHTTCVGQAFRWLGMHGAEMGLDCSRMVLMGHSVGAHMMGTLCLQGALQGCRVRAAVSLEGLFDVQRFWRDEPKWRSLVEHALPKPPAEAAEATTGADIEAMPAADLDRLWPSPTTLQVPTGDEAAGIWRDQQCPWLIVHSAVDPWLQVNQATLWQAHLRHCGIPCTLLVTDAGDHDQVLRWCCAAPDDCGSSTASVIAASSFLSSVVVSFLRAQEGLLQANGAPKLSGS